MCLYRCVGTGCVYERRSLLRDTSLVRERKEEQRQRRMIEKRRREKEDEGATPESPVGSSFSFLLFSSLLLSSSFVLSFFLLSLFSFLCVCVGDRQSLREAALLVLSWERARSAT